MFHPVERKSGGCRNVPQVCPGPDDDSAITMPVPSQLPPFLAASSASTLGENVENEAGTGAGGDISALQTLIVPPLNFDMVAGGVYRSGHPNERNYGFMRRLGLKSIM